MGKDFDRLSEEQKEYIRQNTDKSLEEIVSGGRISSKKIARSYIAHLQKEQRKKRNGILGGLIGACVVSLGLGYGLLKKEKDSIQPPTTRQESPAPIASKSPKVMNPKPRSKREQFVNKALSCLEDALEHNETLYIYDPTPSPDILRELYIRSKLNSSRMIPGNSRQTKQIQEFENQIDAALLKKMLNKSKVITSCISGHEVLENFLTRGEEIGYTVWYYPKKEKIFLCGGYDLRDSLKGSLGRIQKGIKNQDDFYFINFILKEHKMLKKPTRLLINHLYNDLRTQITSDKADIFSYVMNDEYSHVSFIFPDTRKIITPKPKEGDVPIFIGSLHNHNWTKNESSGDLIASGNRLISVVVYDQQQDGFRLRHLYGGRLIRNKNLQIKRSFSQELSQADTNILRQGNLEILSNSSAPSFSYRVTDPQGINYLVFYNQKQIVDIDNLRGIKQLTGSKSQNHLIDYIAIIPKKGEPTIISRQRRY